MRMRWAVMRRIAPSLDAENGLDGVPRDGDDAVHLSSRHDQRGRQEDLLTRRRVLAGRRADTRHQAPLHHLRLNAGPHLPIGRVVPLAAAILYELDSRQQALAASNIPRMRMIAER